jgi:crotonobetainyl-CoA:carnitine CoA-transferase CaiB-like acyl-CoA transferase
MIANGWVTKQQHPVVGEMDTFGMLFDFSETPGVVQGPALVPGQHTREILAEIGMTDDEIEALLATGNALAAEP